MRKIVECVPNFSEGRDPQVYGAIVEVVDSTPGCLVLDVSADRDHNRTVVTFVGEPAAVSEGAFRGIAKAAELIDLEQHRGEHPRIGATDVCPFVPVRGVSTDDCVDLARKLGERVGNELGIAVYLYGEAATSEERRSLSNIRRGEYEQWRDEIGTDPRRRPDFGPAAAKPWGATVIGVRPFLIAYNIFLNSDDVRVANKIARAVRHSSGGLRYVQAMGFLVDGRAQVSMNLTDFNKTPIHLVQELVRREAARFGLTVVSSELIGMAPQDAFLDAAEWYLQLEGFDKEQILELKIAEESAGDITPVSFLEATAKGTPTPGGGSAAALAGALGAALTQMVANLTTGRKKYREVEERAAEISGKAEQLGRLLTKAIEEDVEAFDQVMKAYRDKSLGDAERRSAIQEATIRAGDVPLTVARTAEEVLKLAGEVVEMGNVNAITDAAAGAIMAEAAIQVAALNVRINALDLEDRKLAESWLRQVDEIQQSAARRVQDVKAVAAERGGY